MTEKGSRAGFWTSPGKRVGRRAGKSALQQAETLDEASCEAGEPMLPRKTSKERGGARTKTDTGGQGEDPEVSERTVAKELGKMTP